LEESIVLKSPVRPHGKSRLIAELAAQHPGKVIVVKGDGVSSAEVVSVDELTPADRAMFETLAPGTEETIVVHQIGDSWDDRPDAEQLNKAVAAIDAEHRRAAGLAAAPRPAPRNPGIPATAVVKHLIGVLARRLGMLGVFRHGPPECEKVRRHGAIMRANPSVFVTRPASHVPSGDRRCAFPC
jgi:hypothetical protein